MNKIRFIVNPKSGLNKNAKRIEQLIDAALSKTDLAYEVVYTSMPGEATELARDAVKQHFDMVAVVGGDGTINEAGCGLVDSDTILGIIPSGSGNGMARNLKIPLNKREAVELLINPRTIKLDVGLINDHYFFNVAGFGLDAEVSENYEEFGIRGPVSYFIVGTRTFFKYKSNPVTIRFDNQEINLKPLVVTVANAPEYGVGATIAPAAVPYDGYLDLVVVESLSVWKAVSNVYRLFNGTISEIEEYQHYRVKTVEILRNEAGAIEIDGNVHFEREKLTITILPEKLKVAVGPDFK